MTELHDERCFAVVVSYNRKALLQQCLLALTRQTRPPDGIVIVDNASSDGTPEMLECNGWIARPGVELLALEENSGGAGGFAAGIVHSVARGAQWIWIMDDDAAPQPAALSELLKVADDPANIYGSIAINGADTAWTTTLLGSPNLQVDKVVDVPAKAEVESLPFLGFMVHRKLVDSIGLPDAGYFIAADDAEYCIRARKAGAKLFIAGGSRIHHPKADRYLVRLFGQTLTCLRLPPWKRYYDTRNRLLIGRRHLGWELMTKTIPGCLIRMLSALVREPRRLAQLWAFTAGFIDGLLGRRGRRHSNWGIAQ